MDEETIDFAKSHDYVSVYGNSIKIYNHGQLAQLFILLNNFKPELLTNIKEMYFQDILELHLNINADDILLMSLV